MLNVCLRLLQDPLVQDPNASLDNLLESSSEMGREVVLLVGSPPRTAGRPCENWSIIAAQK
jgi:hypothetical protein